MSDDLHNKIRKGVRDGNIDTSLSGAGFIMLIIECVLVGCVVFVLTKDYMLPHLGGSENIAKWAAVISGLILFFIFFMPKLRGSLSLAFSAFWGLLLYFLVHIGILETSGKIEEGSAIFSSSPFPYLVGLVIFLITLGLHRALID